MEPPEKGTRILMTDLCRVKQARELSKDYVVMSDFSTNTNTTRCQRLADKHAQIRGNCRREQPIFARNFNPPCSIAAVVDLTVLAIAFIIGKTTCPLLSLFCPTDQLGSATKTQFERERAQHDAGLVLESIARRVLQTVQTRAQALPGDYLFQP